MYVFPKKSIFSVIRLKLNVEKRKKRKAISRCAHVVFEFCVVCSGSIFKVTPL